MSKDAAPDDAGADVADTVPDPAPDTVPDPAAATVPVTVPDVAAVPAAPPLFASAPGIGTRIGALHVSALTPFGWAVIVAGIVGTLLIAVSYLVGWLTASLEHFGSSVTESLTLQESTSTPLAWMYRVATLGLIGCAMALLFVPPAVRQVVRLGGFAAAGLSLLSALIATFVITTVVGQGAAYFGDADTVEYGWGLYAGYLGIIGVTCFVGFFGQLHHDAGPAYRDQEPAAW